MPTPMDAMLGLVVASIGLLMLVVAFSLNDTKKKMLSYLLAAVVVTVGAVYFLKAEIRSFQVKRRIHNLQSSERINIDDIRNRLRERNSNVRTAPAPEPERSKPVKKK